MTLPTTSAQNTALNERVRRPVWFVQMDFDVVQRFCSANRTLEWGGHPWVPLGNVASVSKIRSSTEFKIDSIELGISGVPVEIIALVEAEPVAGKLCQVWVGLYDDDYQLIDTPILEYAGRVARPLNRERAADENGVIACDLVITVESRWSAGLKNKIRRRTDADHQAEYPGDTCYRFVPQVTNLVLQGWGR